ncbi:hypothetical protein GDO78_007245 [Eleutherodactylus coqui]|uniref:G-protein coupled receptors family 1 profile domain-containing protein n=1 Tax=Eleutherodactylus coqui TaxID=57060 RepID=A0A8J6FGA0_ELECQ|nr:hypothetical protein GDO78_007245 [Eleutherodactylus coqui]
MSSVNSTFTNSTGTSGVSARIGIAILSIAFIIGFPGNAFVIWTILTQMKKLTVTCVLILHLAMADILVLLTAPFFLHVHSTGSWIFGEIICKMCYYVCCLSMYASVFLIMFMSIDRFLAVAQPFTSQKLRTKQIVQVLVGMIWLLSSLLAISMFFCNALILMNGHLRCIPLHPSPNHMVFQYIFETLTGFVIPFTIVVFCYVYIGLRLRTAKFQTKQKTSRLVIMILVTFVLFWLPYQIVNMLQVSGKIFSSPRLTKAALVARPNVIAFAYLSSSANPILYVFAGGNFIKTAGLGFMARLFEGTASEMSSLRKFSQVLRQRSRTESVEVEKRLEQTEANKNMLSNQTH